MDGLALDYEAWEDHAGWWQNEAHNARQRMHVDDDTIESARAAFGKIGSSTVGAAYAEVLAARRDCGQRMGAFADDVATHIRASLQTYRDTDAGGAQALSS
jgi:hypothetical protein